MRVADLATAAVLMLLGGVVLYDSLRLGIRWSTDGPMSGFFPFWLAAILLSLSGVVFLRALGRAAGPAFVSRERAHLVLTVLWPAVAMVTLTQTIGIYVASTLYLSFYMRWVGRHAWFAVALIALGIPLALFIVFEQWFLVPLPKGPLEDWLGY